VLEAEGVETYVQGEDLFGLQGEIPVGASFEMRLCLVDDEQRPKADNLVKSWLAARKARAAGVPWRCLRCEEQHEPQFVTCWKCGASAEPDSTAET
jgi:hypothetical protein